MLDAAVRGSSLREPGQGRPEPTAEEAGDPAVRIWEEVEAVADELGPWGAVALVAVGTGLRPEELFALEWRDIDERSSVVQVRRAFTRGRLKEWGKTERSRRRVPLRDRVLDALTDVPRRLDVPLVFPSARGGYVDLHNFRAREWIPAIKAAGISRERIYDCRHTYATMSLAAGVSLFSLPAGWGRRST